MLHLECCSSNRSASDIYYRQARDHCLYIGKYIGATQGICYFKFKVPNKTPVVFHNGSKYDYRFTTKELAKVFQGRFEYIEENSEIYKFFCSNKKGSYEIYKDSKKSVETISFKTKFINRMKCYGNCAIKNC